METKPNTTEERQPSLLPSILLIIIYILVIILIRLNLPTPQELLSMLESLYRQFGYLIVFLSGLAESIFLIGFYLPGTSAILLGAVLSQTGVVLLPFIILFGTLGLTLGYTVNYVLGKHGWYHLLSRFGLEKGITMAETKLKAHQKKSLFLGYVSPNTGAFISTASGVVKIPFKTFLVMTFLSQLFWSSVWGLIAYFLGQVFIEFFLNYALFILYGLIALLLLRQAVKAGIGKWF